MKGIWDRHSDIWYLGKNIYDLHHRAVICIYENTFQHPNIFCCRGPMTSELIFTPSSYLYACEQSDIIWYCIQHTKCPVCILMNCAIKGSSYPGDARSVSGLMCVFCDVIFYCFYTCNCKSTVYSAWIMKKLTKQIMNVIIKVKKVYF